MSRRTGYSLLEVLIAFVILTLVLTALLPGQARLLDRTSMQEQKLLAHDYALSTAAQLSISTPATIGTVQNNYQNWLVTTTISPAEHTNSATDVLTLEVRVHDSRNRLLATVHSVMVVQ